MRVRWHGGLVLALAAFAASGAASGAEYAPDDTGEVSAIQNRAYHLGQEFEFSLAFLPYDAFYKSIAPAFAYTYHFSDTFAWEAIRVGYGLNFDTNLKSQLLSLGTAPTFFEEVQLYLTSDIVFSPLYAKAALLNRSVLYGELYGLIGGGAFKTTQAWRPAPNIGIGGRLFLNQTLSVRLEIRENLLLENNLNSVIDVNLGLALNFGSAE